MFKVLALDFDGVILDSVQVKLEAMRRVGEPFGPELRDRLVMFQRIEGGVSRYEKFAWLHREAYGRDMTPQELAEISAQYARCIDDALRACPFLPGFEELFAAWRGKVPIHVCSGAPTEELCALLRARGKMEYFTGIGGYPPAKTPLLASIIGAHGVEPEHVVMVGDTVTDSRAAEENGTLFFGVGEVFANAPGPHGKDLHDLNAWLHTLV